MPRVYNCGACNTRHEPPTGSKCPFMDSQDSSSDSDEDISLNKTVVEKPINKPSSDDRLDKLENMVFKLSEKLMLFTESGSRHRSDSVSSTDSTSSEKFRQDRHSSRSRSPRKLDLKYCYDQIFMDEDFKVSNFQDVMLALFKTFRLFVEEHRDVSGLIDHGQFLAEKASANVYVADAFVQYDKYTRNLASRKGPEVFGRLTEMERNRYFSIENYRDVQAFRGKLKNSSNKRKTTGVCYLYNSESGCTNKSCQYSHKCALCDIGGHASKDCRMARKKDNSSR